MSFCVPLPLTPRLIVKVFALTSAKHRWQRGTMVRFGAARAKVWEPADEPRIRVTAEGPMKDRAQLLRLVHGRILEDLRSYKSLHAEEQWWVEGGWVRRDYLEKQGTLPPEAPARSTPETAEGRMRP